MPSNKKRRGRQRAAQRKATPKEGSGNNAIPRRGNGRGSNRIKISDQQLELLDLFGALIVNGDDFDLKDLCAECGRRVTDSGCSRIVCPKCRQITYCSEECQQISYRRIHNRVCCSKPKLPTPTLQSIWDADCPTLAQILDQWGGCSSQLLTAIGNRALCTTPKLDIHPVGAASMARTVARLLNQIKDDDIDDDENKEDSTARPRLRVGQCHPQTQALFQIIYGVAALSDDPAMDSALLTTPAAAACVRHYLVAAPSFAIHEPGKTVKFVNCLTGAVTNLLATPLSIVALDNDRLKQCANVTVHAIMACARAQLHAAASAAASQKESCEQQSSCNSKDTEDHNSNSATNNTGSNNKHERSSHTDQIQYAAELHSFCTTRELRMLLRNLTYVGIVPDVHPGGKDVSSLLCDTFHHETMVVPDPSLVEFVSLWGTIASNVDRKDNKPNANSDNATDNTDLKASVNAFAMKQLGAIVRFDS